MPDTWTLLNFGAAALLSWAGVGLAMAVAVSRGIVARPGSRASHHATIPTGGGLGMAAAWTLLVLLPGFTAGFPPVWSAVVVPGAALLSLLGWLDDRRPLSLLPRLAVQLTVSLVLLAYLHEAGFGGGGVRSGLYALVLAAILVGTMNLYNFMDGSHGMAGANGVFAGLLLAALFLRAGMPELATPAVVVAGGCAGFLPWNLPRPKIFMGDAGSVPLGFALAALLSLGVLTGGLSLAVAILVLAVFLVDAGLTLIRRMVAGERWYTAHNKHVYQRLIVSGWSHGQVLTLYQALNLFLVLPGVVLGTMYPGWAWFWTGIVYLMLIMAWTYGSLKHGGRT